MDVNIQASIELVKLKTDNHILRSELHRLQEEMESEYQVYHNMSRILIASVIGLILLCIYLAGH